jgi:hypothetical protein
MEEEKIIFNSPIGGETNEGVSGQSVFMPPETFALLWQNEDYIEWQNGNIAVAQNQPA